MRTRFLVPLTGLVLLAAPAALAQTKTYTLIKVTIEGNKTVPTDQIMSVVKEHPGEHITVDDIIADRDAITKLLEGNHVGGSVNPTLRSQGDKAEVVFNIVDNGVQTPQVTQVAPKLDQEIFVGNKSIPTATLQAASGLTPGEDLSDAKITAAQKAIVKAYKDAKLPIAVNVAGQNRRLDNGTYDVTWTITETKAKKAAADNADPQ
jgi:outer membrane protein assembly factor BamA